MCNTVQGCEVGYCDNVDRASTLLDMGLRTKAFDLADALGWSIEELSERSGIGRSTLYAVKKGDRGVGPKVISGLMRAFPKTPFERLFVPAESHSVDKKSDNVVSKESAAA